LHPDRRPSAVCDPFSALKLRALITCAGLACAALVGAAPAGAVLVPGASLDGPGAGIDRLGGVDLSRDGTAALVYTKQDGGALHVFASRVVGGDWQPPQRLDPGLSGDSSQPVVATGDGGRVLIAFVNAGQLYTVTRPAGPAAGGFPAAVPLSGARGASDPSITLSIHGKGYLAYTAATPASGHDVRAAFLTSGGWSLIDAPLDNDPARDAGVGAGRPRIAAAADGLAVVAWGESGSVYARRIWGTSPSVVSPQVSVDSFEGQPGGVADSPEVGAGYDSSTWVTLAFRQTFAQSGGPVSRVVSRRLRGSAFEGPFAADGLPTPAPEGADRPRIAVGGAGDGLLTSERQTTNGTWALNVGHSASPMEIDSGGSTSAPYPVPALGPGRGLVAYQQSGAGAADVRVRLFAADGFAPEATVTDPSLGPTVAAQGLEASADGAGDVVVAFVQGASGARRIVVGGLYVPPGSFSATFSSRFGRSSRPLLTWTPSAGALGGIRYSVAVDGALVATTGGTRARPTPVADGAHTVQITATDRRGQTSSAAPRRLLIDTTAPVARLSVRGRALVGAALRVRLSAVDRPPRGRVATSGLGPVLVRFGDGTAQRIAPRALARGVQHRYRRAGRYRMLVSVPDVAGNVRHLALVVRVAQHR